MGKPIIIIYSLSKQGNSTISIASRSMDVLKSIIMLIEVIGPLNSLKSVI